MLQTPVILPTANQAGATLLSENLLALASLPPQASTAVASPTPINHPPPVDSPTANALTAILKGRRFVWSLLYDVLTEYGYLFFAHCHPAKLLLLLE